MTANNRFLVRLTADFYDAQGSLKYRDIGLNLLGDAGLAVDRVDQHSPELQSRQTTGANGLIVLTPRVTAHSLAASGDLLAIGRFGVGFDSVDVAACTAADVVLFITAGAVDHSVAEATVGWMLALTHHIRVKDQLVRAQRWDERSQYMGCELRGRTLGLIGCGGIGRAVLKLLAGFGMNPPLIHDPYLSPQDIESLGASPATLAELLSHADFVSLHCPLNEQTRNLIAAPELALMQPSAYLINTARGGIVDEEALYLTLAERRIAGAAIDCFTVEPPFAPPKLALLDNVLLAPHCIAWTDELFREIGRCACQGMIDLSQGRAPRGVINPSVLTQRGFQAKWRRAE